MRKVLAISGSNHSKSINYSVLNSLRIKIDGIHIKDLRSIEVPIYSQDLEADNGIPEAIVDLLKEMKSYDAFIINTNEHNGYLSAFFKNILDWMSRAESKFIGNKPVFLLSSSPGGRGGASALESLNTLMGYFGGNVEGKSAFGDFYNHYNEETKDLKETEEVNLLISELTKFVNQ